MSTNPYRVGGPVGGTPSFVGRQDLLGPLQSMLADEQRHALLLWGQRRMGKSSVLQHLQSQLQAENHWLIIDLDWQSRAEFTLDEVLKELATMISLELEISSPDWGIGVWPQFWDWWTAHLAQSSAHLLFLEDEFEVIATGDPPQKREILKCLMQLLPTNPARIKWVFAIGCHLDSLPKESRAFFGHMESRRVGYLEQEDITALIELSKPVQWSEEGKQRLWQKTAGHPYFTQSLCSDIWQHSQASPAVDIRPSDVEQSFKHSLRSADSILLAFWDSLSTAEQVVAVGLAQGKTWDKVAPRTLPVVHELERARDSLIRWQLVAPAPSYQFRVEIIRCWIVENHGADYQTGLDKLVPAAQTIYEVAEKLQPTVYAKVAEQLLEQVLILSPHHFAARRLLARVWEEQRQLAKARQKLEELHQEGILNVQDDLIRVLLAQAQVMRDHPPPQGSRQYSQRSKQEAEQRALYERVLQLDPQNAQAHAGKQQLNKQRAERHWEWQLNHFWQQFFWPLSLGIMALIALVLAYGLDRSAFPENMVFEFAKETETRYILKSIPSSTPSLHLDEVKLELLPSLLKSVELHYDDRKLTLSTMSPSSFTFTKDLLQRAWPDQPSFAYPDKTHEFKFEWQLELSQPSESVPQFNCTALSEQKAAVPCEIKGAGFLQVFRNLPWLGWALLIWGLEIILVLMIQGLRSVERDERY